MFIEIRRLKRLLEALEIINRLAREVNVQNREEYHKDAVQSSVLLAEARRERDVCQKDVAELKTERDEILGAVNQAFAQTRWKISEQE